MTPLIIIGPIRAASMITIAMIIPSTASLFFSRRRHASLHKEVPAITSPLITSRTSFSAKAYSGPMKRSGGSDGGAGGLLSSKTFRADENAIWRTGSPHYFHTSVPDTRIDKSVRNINQQVETQDRDCDKGHDADD